MDPWDQPPPPDDRKGKGKQREKSNTPPELGGSQGSKSSDSTDAGFGLTSAGRGWGSVPTRHFVSVFFFAHPSCTEGNVNRTTDTLEVIQAPSPNRKSRNRI